ncbi:MAG: hypothetical protein HYU86_04860 [Chloroflexi bacterium]|nr:hypothetical protein [Chloroflexota bacterium]
MEKTTPVNVTAIPLYEEGRPPRALWDVDYNSELERVWGRRWGAQSDLGKIELVLVSRPDENEFLPHQLEFRKQNPAFFYLERGIPNLQKLQKELDQFVAIMRKEGIEVVDLNLPPDAKGAYVPFPIGIRGPRDMVILNGGAILPRMGVSHKRGCEIYWARRLLELGCPILYTVHGTGCFEGGNVSWIDSKHVLAGISVRTNPEGLRQVEPIFKMNGVEEVHPVYLSSYMGKSLGYHHHLDVVFGMMDEGLALVYPPGIDTVTLEYLRKKDIELIEVPYEEVVRAACNALAIRPGRVIIPNGNPRTVEALTKRGVQVTELEWDEHITNGGGAGGGGGPVCLTCPLIREPV